MVDDVAPLDQAGPGSLSYATSSAWRNELRVTAADVVLVPESLVPDAQGRPALVVVEDPARAMSTVVAAMYPAMPVPPRIDPTARLGMGTTLGEGVAIAAHALVGDGVRIGDRCRIGPGVVIEDGVVLGSDCQLDAHVVLYRGTRLGTRVRVKASSVLGGEGFGFLSTAAGHERVPQVGGLMIGDDVEIGSKTSIDRGTLGDTLIGDGTKIDNMVHVGHNARIGKHCILAGGSLIAGSVTLGNFVICGGGSGVIDHVVVGDNVRIGVGSPVGRNTPAGSSVSGFPAHPHRETLRVQAAVLRLPQIIAELERMVEERKHGQDHPRA